jgi:hypothetical protein
MTGIIGISALFVILGLSLVITRVATLALVFTGLSPEVARFQARSAFTGTGFTTKESESITSHPVRRRIIMALLMLRSAGLISIVLSLILSFAGTDDSGRMIRLAWIVGGVSVLWAASKNRRVDHAIKYLMQWMMRHRTDIQIIDYSELLKLADDYVIRELVIDEEDWIANRKLKSCSLRQEGLEILGIHRSNGDYVGVPRGDSEVYPEDRIVLYGPRSALKNLDLRRKGSSGDVAHNQAVNEESRRMEKQKQEEADYESGKKDSPL